MTLTITDFLEYLTGVVDNEPWRTHAACKSLGPALFYAERGGSQAEAMAVCRCCPVRVECLEHALSEPEMFGYWGGASERERKKLRRVRKLEVVG